MTARVYLETSVVSYLTARPSRDLVVAGHQQVTEDWWRTRKGDFELLVSPLVIQEAHIANAELLPRVARLVERRGFPMPFVCTPEELLGGPREH